MTTRPLAELHSRILYHPENANYTFTNPYKMRVCWVCGELTEFKFLGIDGQHPECEEEGWNA